VAVNVIRIEGKEAVNIMIKLTPQTILDTLRIMARCLRGMASI